MTPVEIIPVQGSLVLRARGSELLILPSYIAELKARNEPKEFASYFLSSALINRPARKLFEAWLRKDRGLWQRLFSTVNEMEVDPELKAENDQDSPKPAEPAVAEEKPVEKPVATELSPTKEAAKPAKQPTKDDEEADTKKASAKKVVKKPVAKAPAKKKVAKKAEVKAPAKKKAATTSSKSKKTTAAAKPAAAAKKKTVQKKTAKKK